MNATLEPTEKVRKQSDAEITDIFRRRSPEHDKVITYLQNINEDKVSSLDCGELSDAIDASLETTCSLVADLLAQLKASKSPGKSIKSSKRQELNREIVEKFKVKSKDHESLVCWLTKVSARAVEMTNHKAAAKSTKLSVSRTSEILQELSTALKLSVATKRRVYVPEFNHVEFKDTFERFCARSPNHALVARTALYDPEASTKHRETLNKTKLAAITNLSPREVETIIDELRTAFSEF